jgi:hypothetical protein
MMGDPIHGRLTLMKQEFAKGQLRLQEMERQEAALRETLLRLSGAIEVLEEIVSESAPPPANEERSADLLPSLGRRVG